MFVRERLKREGERTVEVDNDHNTWAQAEKEIGILVKPPGNVDDPVVIESVCYREGRRSLELMTSPTGSGRSIEVFQASSST